MLNKADIHDLHGNVFDIEQFSFNPHDLVPKNILGAGEVWIFTKNILTGQLFILVKHQGKYGFVKFANRLYVYGTLIHKGYIIENDIRNSWKVKKKN